MANEKSAYLAAVEKLNAEKNAALIRAETAEAYLQQAEQRIEELEQMVHELASKVPQSDIEFLSGSKWDQGLAEMLQEQRRFSEMYGRAKEFYEKLSPQERQRLAEQFRNEYFEYNPEADAYRRKPQPRLEENSEQRKAREDKFRREYEALKNQIPPGLKKEAEKYLNDFLGSDASPKRQADEFEERKTGGVPGARYRMQFYATQPGDVEVRVEKGVGLYRIGEGGKIPDSHKYWAMRLPDNVTEDELRKLSTQYACVVVKNLKIGGDPEAACQQLAADIFHGYVDLRKKGAMRHTVER